jgi:hypothetical protein
MQIIVAVLTIFFVFLIGSIVLWFLTAFRGHHYRLYQSSAWTLAPDNDPTGHENNQSFCFEAGIVIKNDSRTREYLISNVTVAALMISKSGKALTSRACERVAVIPPDGRRDGYWPVWVVEPHNQEKFQIRFGSLLIEEMADIAAVWIRVRTEAHGPHGIEAQRAELVFSPEHVINKSRNPNAISHSLTESSRNQWRDAGNLSLVLPIKTPLLTNDDDVIALIREYVAPIARSGDVITIAESPLAITQGHYRHPDSIKVGLVARLFCIMFPTKTSFGRPHGLQALIDTVGIRRFLWAMLVGQIAKRLKIRGAFYRACGWESPLIDDISGTLPPYDSFIILAPEKSQAICDTIKKEFGIEAAVVDISYCTQNNIILAHTEGVTPAFLLETLAGNPAGNDNEMTPLVLIRPGVAKIVNRRSAKLIVNCELKVSGANCEL